MQHALRAERVDAPAGDGRGGARSFVEAEIVAILGRVIENPDRGAGLGVERLDDLFGAYAMKQDQPAGRYHRTGEALSDVLFPDHRRAALGPFRRQVAARIDAVARRPEELRPVLGERAGGHDGEDHEWNSQSCSQL